MADSSGDAEYVRSWEPMDGSGLPGLRLLARAAARVEGDALARLDAIGDDDLGELIVWAWVFDADRTHVLMVDHHLFDVWVHPGGRAAPGEDPLAAAARELLEETGTTGVPTSSSPALVDAIDRVSPAGRPVTTFGAAFVFEGDRNHPLSPEDGQPARWWPLARPPDRRREHLWDRMVEHLAQRGDDPVDPVVPEAIVRR
jgi:8-oxo-dGTP pyrophosphatase MutT (NUDIX family)